MMPAGPILLAILLVLAATCWLDGVLARLGLSVRAGVALLTAMLLGSLVEVPLAPGLTVNVGTGLLPLAYAIYLLAGANRWYEPLRAMAGALVTAGAVFLLGRWFPPGQPTELNLFYLDAHYLYGLTAGAVGYLAGHSRRSAFCAAVLGVLLADMGHFLRLMPGIPVFAGTLALGGGGFQGTPLVAAVIAVALVELVGDEVHVA